MSRKREDAGGLPLAVNVAGVAGLDLSKLAKVNIQPSMFTHEPVMSPIFDQRLKASGELRDLIGKPPVLSGNATRELDGRRVPVCIVLVRDEEGQTQAGILVRLVQGVRLRDHSRTNARGIVLLRFPLRSGDDEDADVVGTVEVRAPGITLVSEEITIPAGSQHTVLEIELDALPDVGVGGVAPGGDEDAGDDGQTALSIGGLTIPIQDNPLDRLPADFSTELSSDLTNLLGTTEDPIFGLLGEATDFRRQRGKLLKNVTILRIGSNPPGDEEQPRRYLVRLRQEWTFLGYTLGELADVEALDPGTIIQETTETVQRTVERVSRSLDRFTSQAFETTTSSLRQRASIDTLLDVATSTSTLAAAGGFGFFIPPFIGGFVAGGARVTTTATTRSSTDTSLVVNSGLQVARSLVNEAVRTSVSSLREVESAVTSAIGRVSPLLSRVTNLLRWTLYENYIVTTHVEDIVEVLDVKMVETLGTSATPLFSDEDIVEYEPFFSRALLNQKLRPEFDVLRRAVAIKRAASLPVSVIHVTVNYSAAFIGADLIMSVNGEVRTITLRPGTSRVTESFRLLVPIAMPIAGTGSPAVSVAFALMLRSDLTSPFFFGGSSVNLPGVVHVSRANFRFESSPGNYLESDHHFGNDLEVKTDGPVNIDLEIFDVQVPPPAVFTQGNPLFLHVNRNRHYYYGLLARAALVEPSLRDDAKQLSDAFNSDHDLWRLPLIGFEADRALVIGDVNLEDPDVQQFLADPGAATIVQLAAPGAYAEALQGLLQLADAAGKIHPNLIPLPAPVMPPLAIFDLTGKQLQVVPTPEGGEVPPVPGGGGGGIPPIPGGGGLPIP